MHLACLEESGPTHVILQMLFSSLILWEPQFIRKRSAFQLIHTFGMFSTFGADPVIFVEGSKAAVALEFVFWLSHALIIPTVSGFGRLK